MEPRDSGEGFLDPKIIETFKKVEEIVAKLPKDSVQKVTLLKGGGMDITSLADIMSEQNSLNLSDFKEGDVIWWITENGGKYYHMIKKPYKAEGAYIIKAGGGPFKGTTSQNELVEHENAGIHGSSYGGALRLFHINQGVPVEVLLFPRNPGEKGKTFRTSSVASMGVIKTEQYRNT